MSKSVLITGAGSGFGLACALDLAERGWRVFASFPHAGYHDAVIQAAQTRKVRLEPLLLDVTDPAAIGAAVAQVIDAHGRIDALVNSAGIGLRGFFEDLADDEIRRMFDVNVFGTMNVVRAVLPHMRAARSGRVVLITSAGGRIASMTISAYCAGKFALEGFGESLALEVAPFGIQVSLVEPGLVLTPHFTIDRGRARNASRPESPYYRWFLQHEAMVDAILQQRRITPIHVAQAVARALHDRRPRLRYVVGWRVQLLLALRRLLPGELFERIYSRQVIKRVTAPTMPADGLADLRLPENYLDRPQAEELRGLPQ
ncbi:MAG: SDR family oxidoreductase [Oscillochloris sp.]|nr:SDR family oxidoreductase [Oscillochloris sp.]